MQSFNFIPTSFSNEETTFFLLNSIIIMLIQIEIFKIVKKKYFKICIQEPFAINIWKVLF